MGEWLQNANTKAKKSNKAEIRGAGYIPALLHILTATGKVDGNGYKLTETVTSKVLQSGRRCGRMFIRLTGVKYEKTV